MASRRQYRSWLLRAAARDLKEEAQLQRESCQVGKRDWACGDCFSKDHCPPRRRHAELTERATALRRLAKEI